LAAVPVSASLLSLAIVIPRASKRGIGGRAKGVCAQP
jgi:hypothetical protein